MGLGESLGRATLTSASKTSATPPPAPTRVATSTPQTSPQQSSGPADPNLLTPRTPGTIGVDRAQWPLAFGSHRGETFLTAAKFEGLDETGMAKIRRPGPSQPIMTVDIGVSDMPPGERQAVSDKLASMCARAPLMLQNKVVNGQPFMEPYEIATGDSKAQTLKVRPAIATLKLINEQKDFMDPQTFQKAIQSIEKEIVAMPLAKVPKMAPGEKSGDWLDKSVNSSIVQTVENLKSKGYPYNYGSRNDLDGAMDCSAFVGAVMRRAGKNVNDSTGKPLFDKMPAGYAASIVDAAMKNGGAMCARELLAHPRPGCMIGLDTGDKKWDRGRPHGIDHIAVTFQDKAGKFQVAEFSSSPAPGGLHVSPMEPWIQKYAAHGAGVYVASPGGLCNKQILAQIEADSK